MLSLLQVTGRWGQEALMPGGPHNPNLTFKEWGRFLEPLGPASPSFGCSGSR